VGRRILIGELIERPPRTRHRVLEPFDPVPGREEVVRHLGRIGVTGGLERLADAAVQGAPARGAGVLIDGLADERVHEHVRPCPRLVDESGPDADLERVEHGSGPPPVHGGDELVPERATDHSGGAQRAQDVGAQLGQSRRDELLHAVRDAERRVAHLQDEPSVALDEHVTVVEVTQQLHDEERVACRVAAQRRPQRRRSRPPFEGADQLRDLVLGQAVQRDALDRDLVSKVGHGAHDVIAAGQLCRAVCRDPEQPGVLRRAGDVSQQQQRRRVGPVQVLEHEHHRPLPGAGDERAADRLEQQVTGGHVVADGRSGTVGGQLRHHPREAPGVLTQHGARELAQHLDERLVRDEGLRVAAAEQDAGAVGVGLAREPRGEAGLPDARLAGQQHEACLAGSRRSPGLAQTIELSAPGDERASGSAGERSRKRRERLRACFVVLDGRLATRADARRGRPPAHRVRDDRLVEALEFDLPELLERDRQPAAAEHPHGLRHEDLAARGGVAEPARRDHRRAVQVAALVDRLSCVDADAKPDAARLLVDGLLHGGRTSHRRPRARECGHEPVADALHLMTVVVGDRAPEEREVRAADVVGGIVAELREELGRADDVRDHDREDIRFGHHRPIVDPASCGG
jgi:hypothetical protein